MPMSDHSANTVIRRAAYRRPDYWITTTQLIVDIRADKVIVHATLRLRAAAPQARVPLVLDGCGLRTRVVMVNDRVLAPDDFRATDRRLVIAEVPDGEFTLETTVEIDPFHNLALEGLYQSGDILCTQCEAEGFRRITWYLDRPDVMSVFTTTIRGDLKRYPYLLGNGNLTDSGDWGEGRHFATWHDPFPKPCYLFALVAGDFDVVDDAFTTSSGRAVTLRIFTDKGNAPRCGHAMASLKNAMRWDEERFGLEYDLDLFMLVAVASFNAGAMENKGLNIFNSAYVLADPATATDTDYLHIESVVGHEYFHNWTGDRVTCRDWFQLTLKEGLTVFRDRVFSADMNSAAVKRIDDVRSLRESQFPEDAGPNRHPIRPEAYGEINNFYTATVYQKGAEVVGMLETLLGRDGFRRGIAKYFALFDGQAVTCEDFVQAMELATGADLAQFRRWYAQAGTPRCQLSGEYLAATQEYRLTVRQTGAQGTDGTPPEPFYFPLAIGLIGPDGKDLPLRLQTEVDAAAVNEVNEVPPVPGAVTDTAATTLVLPISQAVETFTFTGIPAAPLPSLFRNFSAPVTVEFAYTHAELARLLACDSDAFNRYDAGQRLATLCLEEMMTGELRMTHGQSPAAPVGVPDLSFGIRNSQFQDTLTAFGTLLADAARDPAFVAKALVLPTLTTLTMGKVPCDFQAAFAARERFLAAFAHRHETVLLASYDQLRQTEYRIAAPDMGARALRNLCLSYLSYLGGDYVALAYRQFRAADNMTDSLAALAVLAQLDCPERETALAEFRDQWQHDFNVLNKWFAVQAGAKRADTLADVRRLMRDPAFAAQNPNRLRALYGAFGRNYLHFHAVDGSGYEFLAERIMEIDAFNPHVAAGFAKLYEKYAVLDDVRKTRMRAQLERLLAHPALSPGLAEIVEKTLAAG